ncbi:two-component system sensor histidine kinase CreC [Xanthomonas hortorum]|uniref:histidine kinase n=1 Tax=Xanthomonas hortorum pv. pelargonii TaxID=453602 RepID=A0A6V7DV56_9XANT|nr:two-component system sensor histidine kinase CreC [Xanthomonas hortorum]MCE4355132.1 two-component system sensor histidine kinase CreC [Xanthomonas hortorum pv. pelargonii]MCM5526717.1 two-component system sensor histidine kinase CreC [Xanthomonas hortorum pv. pelargonii]MCM5538657.1 two-component system sensor histidine kinase CreC [Xanthomonas hortorum pv. pelargonii]MCM5542881.1 two-component system sensor histidine kinase CreC [Xanthomonas hortorum pv. pelargonii]MCM5547080.1 two-compon
MRLGLKLFLGFFLIVGLAAFFVMRVFVNEVKPGVRQAMESTLVDAANVLAEMASGELAGGTIATGSFARNVAQAQQRDPKARVWRFRKNDVAYRVTVTDARGVVVFDSLGRDVGRDNSRWNDVYRTLRGEYGARSSPEVDGDPTATVMHVAAPIYAPNDAGKLIGVLTLAQPNRSIDPFIEASQRNILQRGAWLIGISALIGILMTWWLMRGIGRLNRYAQAVSAGIPVPPPKPRGDEIGDLGQALESMRRKLEGKAYVEQYVQSLTHEMKSPLAAIRGASELLSEPLPEADRQHFVASIRAQELRLTETIDKLLALAEVEQHGWLQKRERIAVAGLLHAAVDAVLPRATAAGVRVEIDVASDAAREHYVLGDGFLLRQALINLLENAVAFSPEGSTVQLRTQLHDGKLQVSVQDRGSGVPDYAVERVFERFYSLARPQTGQRSSGLGLPFVREVARLHGGEVALGNREGGGAMATLRLPAG